MWGVDAQFQYIGDVHALTAPVTFTSLNTKNWMAANP
jgi:hypothetical protein